MRLNDKISFGQRVTDGNGFVAVPAVITKVGVQKYHVDELRREPKLRTQLTGMSGLIGVFRGPDTVFNPLTIDSFKNLPVTVQHPDGMVDTSTARFVQAGHIGADVSKIGDACLGATIHLTDKDAIEISKGSETSAGYDCPIIADTGTYAGEEYNFRFDGPMIGNHLALVPAGRCGDECKVLDKQQEKDMDEKKVTELVETTVADAIAKAMPSVVAKAIADADMSKIVSDKVDEAFKVKEESDEAKAKLDAEAAEAKKLDDAEMSKKIALHAKLQNVLDSEYDSGKTDHELLVLAVGDTITDAESKSDEYLTEKVDEIAKERKDAQNVQFDSKNNSDVPTINLTALAAKSGE